MKHQFFIALFFALTGVSMHAQTTSSQTAESIMRVNTTKNTLAEMRQQIDSIDSLLIDLLARRLQVCQAIGEYKKRYGIAVVQKDRYHEILEKRSRQGASKGLAPIFVKSIMNLIHDESVAQQEKLKREGK